MNKLNLRNRKKGVTPVIATIILIAGTLVLALVVGAYTFGLFGSNVKTVTLSSATLYGGVAATSGTGTATSSLTIALNNPGSQSYVNSVTLTGAGLTTPITTWDNTSGVAATPNKISFASASMGGVCPSPTWNNNVLCPGQVSSFTVYPEQGSGATGPAITTGQTFNYVINFQNGQSVSGSLIAQ